MKKGDVVTVRDSSYSKVITEHGLESGYDGINSVKGERGIIIELNCDFPDPNKFQQRYRHFNNTIVKTNSGKIVFIEEDFLDLVMPPTHKVMIDIRQNGGWMYGQIIEISNELYKQIKK